MNYIIAVHFKESITEYFLPNVNNKKLPIDISYIANKKNQIAQLSLEVWNNLWVITENEKIEILKPVTKNKKIILEPSLIMQCRIKNSSEKFIIIIDENYPDYSDFNKYILPQGNVSIGNKDGNSIQYNINNLVSSVHAIIETDSNGISLIIDKSSNGTYVNGKKIEGKVQLNFGDIIYILGLKIIYLNNIIAVNNPINLMKIRGIEKYIPANIEIVNNDTIIKDKYYLCTPRRIELLDEETVEIESPPSANKMNRMPLLFTIGPSFTMIIPMAVGALFTIWRVNSGDNATSSPFMFMGIITSVTAAFIGVFWALMNYRYNKQNELKNETKRLESYKNYIDKIRRTLTEKHIRNKEILDNTYPAAGECMKFSNNDNRKLWERNINHTDFLTIRLGSGSIPSPNNIIIPKERFSMIDNDDIADIPKKIQDEYKSLNNAPIIISLLSNSLIGIIGNSQKTCNSIANIVSTQIAAYHSYVDVKMVFIYNETEQKTFNYAKWLPHTWSEDNSIRMIGYNQTSIGEVFYHLSNILRVRIENIEQSDKNNKNDNYPHYVIIITDPELVEREPIIKYFTYTKNNIGITTILAYQEIGKLPNNCTVIVQNDDDYKGYYSIDSKFKGYGNVKFDDISHDDLEKFSRELANIRVREAAVSGEIPQLATFMDMFKVSKIEEIDIEQKWLENRTYESMKAPIGFRNAESLMYLDISEKYHGPHGLVAGTTGSGKSETLQTYILSLAINYHPYEVSFILIDYKGGGMAGSFENLPHIAGIITNLGGNQTNRALASINSEIKRRQAIFNDNKIKHIDTYIEMYRANKVTMPLPHLLIIADEFAELKKEQPEFVRALVSASRVGRSLGVHLILATQKPSGVVDDEIWGNSKFRLCLRVQDKQDSNEMVKRPDAAYITNAGRGYFQVGNDEIFEEFQSGWSGAKYEPEILYSDNKQSDVKMINLWGKPCIVGGKKNNKSKDEMAKKPTQLEAIVSYVALIAQKQKIKAIDNIWLPPLQDKVVLQDIEIYSKYAYRNGKWIARSADKGINAVIGIVDDPVNQRQYPLILDILDEGHILISASVGSGKTTLLQTMLYSLVTTYSPEAVNIYIIDFNSRTLGIFNTLPHVGDVLYDDSNADKGAKFINMMQKELNRRKMEISRKGFLSYKDYSRKFNDEPAIIVAIDNFPSFYDSCAKYEDNIIQLVKDSASYGIYFIITCTNTNDVRNKIKQNFTLGIGVQLNDRFEYESVLNERVDFIAEDKIPGRGLVCSPRPLEFQTAVCSSAGDAIAINEDIKKQFAVINRLWTGKRAVVIPQVPEDMSYDNFIQIPEIASILDTKRYLPIGYDIDEATPLQIDLAEIFCYSIIGGANVGKTNMLKVIMSMAKHNEDIIYVFDNTDHDLKNFSDELDADTYITTSEELYDLLEQKIISAVGQRKKAKEEFVENNRSNIDEYILSEKKIYLFINDMSAFCEAVYTSEKDMKTFLEKMIQVGDQRMIYLVTCLTPYDFRGEYGTTSVIRKFANWKTGIHLGGNTDDQNIFDFELSNIEKNKKTAPGYGYVIDDNKTKRIITPLI